MPQAGAKAIAASSSFIMSLILFGSILGPGAAGIISDLAGDAAATLCARALCHVRFTALVVSALAPIAVTVSGLLLGPRGEGRPA